MNARNPQGEKRGVGRAGSGIPKTVTNQALLVDGSDFAFRELINNLLLMSKQVQELRGVLAQQLGVTEPQYRVLLTVSNLQGEAGVSVSAVANTLRVSGAFVTAEAGKLVRKGLIEKRDDAADRRSVLLSLSEQGRQALMDFAERPQAINDELFRGFTRGEFQFLSEIVRRLVANGERAALVARMLASKEDDRTFAGNVAPKPRKVNGRKGAKPTNAAQRAPNG